MTSWTVIALLQGQEVAMYILAGSIGVSLMVGSLAWSIAMMVNKIRSHGKELKRRTAPTLPESADAKALETYKALALEKLAVIKTALTMGYSDTEIERLDARLEKLIGKDSLGAIMRGESPAVASADLLDTELDREIERLRAIRDKH